LDIRQIAGEGGRPLDGELREHLLEPFVTAASVALREMAGTEVAVQGVCRNALPATLGDVSAVLPLTSGVAGPLVISFPEQTATGLAVRILEGEAVAVAADVVADCVGEVANVIAGQAKALLAGTPYHFAFGTPRVVSGAGHEIPSRPGEDCLVAVFASDVGTFALQLFLSPRAIGGDVWRSGAAS
jgi:chemotaxis protein CheX